MESATYVVSPKSAGVISKVENPLCTGNSMSVAVSTVLCNEITPNVLFVESLIETAPEVFVILGKTICF